MVELHCERIREVCTNIISTRMINSSCYLKHGRKILKQHCDVFIVGVGPELRLGVFDERTDICISLVLDPAEKLCKPGLHIGTVGFK